MSKSKRSTRSTSRRTFKQTKLAYAVSTALASTLFGGTALAQDNNGGAMEEVVVSGIRGSLQRSMDLKRDAVGVVDAISAEDIGKFPDTNLAQSMQRVPGISVTHQVQNVPGVPSSTGQATAVTVRGFGPSFNTTLYDGRQLAASTGGRGFDFSTVGADSVKAIEVNKTPDATLSSGAIGATINIVNRLPFDNAGLQLSGSLSSTTADNAGSTTNASIQFSNTFADDTFGILVDVSSLETKTQGHHVNNQGWVGTHLNCSQLADPATCQDDGTGTDTAPSWFTQDFGFYVEDNDDKRTGARLALQWQPASNLLTTVDYNYSKDELESERHAFSVWFNGTSLQNVERSANGTVTNFLQADSPTDFQGEFDPRTVENNDIGLNVKWDATEQTTYVFDYSHSESERNPNGEMSVDMDLGYGGSTAGGTNSVTFGIVSQGGDSLPYPNNFGPGGDESNFLGTGIIGSHVLPLTSAHHKDTIDELKLQGSWEGDTLRVDYGVQFLENEQHLSQKDTFQNNQWQAFAGYGPASNNFANKNFTVGWVDANGNALDAAGNMTSVSGNDQYTWTVDANPANNPSGVPIPAEFFGNPIGIGGGFINDYGNGDKLPSQIPNYNGPAVMKYLESLGNPYANGGSALNPQVVGFNYGPGCQSTSTTKDGPCVAADPANGPVSSYDGTFDLASNVGSFQVIEEHTSSFFLKLTQHEQLGSMPLTINAGARYERTTLRSTGMSQQPSSLTIQATDETAFLVAYTPVNLVTATNDYDYLLPNLDLNLDLTDQWKLRLDLGRSLTRPALTQISPNVNVGQGQRVGALTATGNNPKLLPYVADNVDFGAEWYYGDNSYVSADAFLKVISNFITRGTVTRPINNVMDPTTGQLAQFAVTSFVNSSTPSKVHGLELAWQHTFGDSGFGLQLNTTVMDTDNDYDPHNLQSTGNPITGLADSWNAMVFYEKYGLGIRLAAAHQDESLNAIGQQQNTTQFSTEPTFIKANTYWNLSVNYDINDTFSVYLTGDNLTNEVYATRGRFSDQLLDVVDTGKVYTIGVSAKL